MELELRLAEEGEKELMRLWMLAEWNEDYEKMDFLFQRMQAYRARKENIKNEQTSSVTEGKDRIFREKNPIHP